MRPLRYLLLGMVALVAVAMGIAAALGIASVSQLPQVSELATFRPSSTTRIYDRNGELLAEFFQERRHIIPLGGMPRHLINAVLAAEDPRFYTHEGLDFRGIARALVADIRHGSMKQGGSTITQQLARVLFLSTERTLMRKLREALLAMLIERRYTKDEILWLYLNQIYLGSGAYGVEAAAQTYFSKNASALTLPEAALIAGLPQAPSAYTPFRNPARAVQRRNHVLRRMWAEGFLPEVTYKRAIQAPMQLAPRQAAGQSSTSAPFWVEMIRQYLESSYGAEAIYHTGLEVHTTLDLTFQRDAQKALRQGLRELDRRGRYRGVPTSEEVWLVNLRGRPGPPQPGDRLLARVREVRAQELDIEVEGQPGIVAAAELKWTGVKDFRLVVKPNDAVIVRLLADGDAASPSADGSHAPRLYALEQEPKAEGAVVAMETESGAVRAMVGGYDFARNQFNRAMQARRQPGSAFKPIIYAAAIERGATVVERILDTPVVYEDPRTHKVWKPRNFSNKFYGPISLREALEHSRNVATVKLLRKVGIGPVLQLAKNLGITSLLPPFLSLALGAGEVSLLELTSAYLTFANEGIRPEPYFLTRVVDHEGRVLEEHVPRVEPVMSKETAYLMAQLLRGVVLHGTGRNVRDLDLFLAGKTGTTNDFTDAWFIGFTPGLALGVWVGNDDNTPLGKGETGAQAALPVWRAFFVEYLKRGGPRRELKKPETILEVEIDQQTGLLPDPACGPTFVEVFRRGTAPERSCREAHPLSAGTYETEVLREERVVPDRN
ncbi:MAG: PBP1A family penicillin-binding protein [Candidatus Tectomicrobia bacterium]|nr:PBP1A family penicillin-binding protein [Candidatus Tectomicrobia bacterium]